MTKSEYFTNLWETHLEWKLLVPHLAWMRFLITCNSFPLKVMVIDFWFIYKEPCRRLRSASIIPPFFALVLIPISHSLEGLRENKLSHAPLWAGLFSPLTHWLLAAAEKWNSKLRCDTIYENVPIQNLQYLQYWPKKIQPFHQFGIVIKMIVDWIDLLLLWEKARNQLEYPSSAITPRASVTNISHNSVHRSRHTMLSASQPVPVLVIGCRAYHNSTWQFSEYYYEEDYFTD